MKTLREIGGFERNCFIPMLGKSKVAGITYQYVRMDRREEDIQSYKHLFEEEVLNATMDQYFNENPRALACGWKDYKDQERNPWVYNRFIEAFWRHVLDKKRKPLPEGSLFYFVTNYKPSFKKCVFVMYRNLHNIKWSEKTETFLITIQEQELIISNEFALLQDEKDGIGCKRYRKPESVSLSALRVTRASPALEPLFVDEKFTLTAQDLNELSI